MTTMFKLANKINLTNAVVSRDISHRRRVASVLRSSSIKRPSPQQRNEKDRTCFVRLSHCFRSTPPHPGQLASSGRLDPPMVRRSIAQAAAVVSTASVQCNLLRASGVGPQVEKLHFRDLDQKPPVVAAKCSIRKMGNGGEVHLDPFPARAIRSEKLARLTDF